MTAVPIDGGGLGRREPLHRRTGSAVWRNSRPKSDRWWRPFTVGEAKRLRRAFRIYSEGLRPEKGQKVGCETTISRGAEQLMDLMINLSVSFQGRLEPSLQYLAYKLRTNVRTVHAWKRQLEEHGFLRWTRRYVDAGRAGLRGPQVEQTTNAYVLCCPDAAAKAAAKKLGQEGEDSADKAERLRRRGSPLMAAVDRLGYAVQDEAQATPFAPDQNVGELKPENPD